MEMYPIAEQGKLDPEDQWFRKHGHNIACRGIYNAQLCKSRGVYRSSQRRSHAAKSSQRVCKIG